MASPGRRLGEQAFVASRRRSDAPEHHARSSLATAHTLASLPSSRRGIVRPSTTSSVDGGVRGDHVQDREALSSA